MPETARNAEVLRAAIEGWNACKGQAFDCWLDRVTDDVRMRSLADGDHGIPFTESRDGRSQIVAYLEGLTGNFEMIDWQANEFIAEGDRVVAIGETRWRARATGREFHTPIVLIARFRDGRICELFELYDTAKVAGTLA